ncbi:zinc knuckle CX2CX4HX4C containing protein [Tanacetum coccineum]
MRAIRFFPIFVLPVISWAYSGLKSFTRVCKLPPKLCFLPSYSSATVSTPSKSHMADEFFESPSAIKSKSIAQPPTNPIIVTIEENVNGHLREMALNATLKGKVFEVLKNWHERSIQVIVVTDGEHLCLWAFTNSYTKRRSFTMGCRRECSLESRMSNTSDKGTTFGDGAARVGMQLRSSPKVSTSSPLVSPDLIVRSVDINAKSTSYAGAMGFISRKWSMDTRLLKEELTRIPIWVKLHDVPIQGFEEDGISLIATFIGYKVRVDSRGDVVTIGIPSLSEDDFTKGISMLSMNEACQT